MSIQSNKVLRDLVESQRFDGNMIAVDFNQKCFGGLRESDECDKVRVFRYSSTEMVSIFRHLSREGYIEDVSNGRWELLIVTHSGNHRTQSRITLFLKFLSSSVLVPIIVALLTSVAYHIFAYWFPWFRAA